MGQLLACSSSSASYADAHPNKSSPQNKSHPSASHQSHLVSSPRSSKAVAPFDDHQMHSSLQSTVREAHSVDVSEKSHGRKSRSKATNHIDPAMASHSKSLVVDTTLEGNHHLLMVIPCSPSVSPSGGGGVGDLRHRNKRPSISSTIPSISELPIGGGSHDRSIMESPMPSGRESNATVTEILLDELGMLGAQLAMANLGKSTPFSGNTTYAYSKTKTRTLPTNLYNTMPLPTITSASAKHSRSHLSLDDQGNQYAPHSRNNSSASRKSSLTRSTTTINESSSPSPKAITVHTCNFVADPEAKDKSANESLSVVLTAAH